MKTTSVPIWHCMVTYWNGIRWRTMIFNLQVEENQSPSVLAEQYFQNDFCEGNGYEYSAFWEKNRPAIDIPPLTVEVQPMGRAIKIEEE